MRSARAPLRRDRQDLGPREPGHPHRQRRGRLDPRGAPRGASPGPAQRHSSGSSAATAPPALNLPYAQPRQAEQKRRTALHTRGHSLDGLNTASVEGPRASAKQHRNRDAPPLKVEEPSLSNMFQLAESKYYTSPLTMSGTPMVVLIEKAKSVGDGYPPRCQDIAKSAEPSGLAHGDLRAVARERKFGIRPCRSRGPRGHCGIMNGSARRSCSEFFGLATTSGRIGSGWRGHPGSKGQCQIGLQAQRTGTDYGENRRREEWAREWRANIDQKDAEEQRSGG